MKSTKWTIFIRLIFIAFCTIFGIVGLFKFNESLFITCILLVVLGTILFAIHIPLLVKYYRLAKVCTAYEGTFVEFASPAFGFACVRVKFTVNGEEKTMDSLRVYHNDRRPLGFNTEQILVGYSPLYDYVIIL